MSLRLFIDALTVLMSLFWSFYDWRQVTFYLNELLGNNICVYHWDLTAKIGLRGPDWKVVLACKLFTMSLHVPTPIPKAHPAPAGSFRADLRLAGRAGQAAQADWLR